MIRWGLNLVTIMMMIVMVKTILLAIWMILMNKKML